MHGNIFYPRERDHYAYANLNAVKQQISLQGISLVDEAPEVFSAGLRAELEVTPLTHAC